ncbi:MAG: MFS transporter, partial [Armatimonadota bacterium]
MSTLDASIVSVAMPTLTTAFRTTVSTSQWFVLAYTSVVTVFLLVSGKLGDMVGRRRLYVWGVLLFTAGSLVCGLSISAAMLIAARALQAIGASIMMSGGPALVTDAFPSQQRGRSLGIIGSSVALGLLAGPLVGGLIIQYLSWHWMFFINVPIGLAL